MQGGFSVCAVGVFFVSFKLRLWRLGWECATSLSGVRGGFSVCGELYLGAALTSLSGLQGGFSVCGELAWRTILTTLSGMGIVFSRGDSGSILSLSDSSPRLSSK